MTGFLIAIAFLLAAPGKIYSLSLFQVPPHNGPSPVSAPAPADAGLEKATDPYSRSRTVMPVLLEYLPYAQALEEGIPGITSTSSPYDKNPMPISLVIPLTPEDLPFQSQNRKDDMRDALAPANSAQGQDPAGAKHCGLRQAGQCPFSQMEFTPEGIKRCKYGCRLLWWTRILPVPAFNILLQKLHFPQSKAPELKTGKLDSPAGYPSFADEIFSQ